MKKANLILGSSIVILTGLLASCNPTTPIIPVAAPQNILTIPDENDVTVVWDAVVDARVKGYNVYQDGTKVNSAPVLATSRVQAQNTVLGGVKPVTFVVKNVLKTKLSDFSVRAITDLGEGLVSAFQPARPLLCTRYKIEGTDMGGLAQNVRLTKSAANLTTATVTVITGSRTVLPFVPSASIYQGNLPATVAVGAPIQILTDDDNCLVYSYDSRPESPVMTAPAAGNVSSGAVLPVAWSSATNPDRFVVSATWRVGPEGESWTSADLPATARSVDIPAGTIPPNRAVVIRVFAYNDGTENFIGAFQTGSKMAIRNGIDAGTVVTTNVPTSATLPGVSWGDPHLITFDQLGYEFQSVGEYDLGYSSDNQLRVQARHQPWGGSSYVSVNTAIATQMNGQKVGLYLNPPAGQSPLRVGNTGVRTAVPSSGLDLGAGNKVSLTGSSYKFVYPTGDVMIVDMADSYINVKVYPVITRAGSMKGLLGNFDGNLTNEFVKRDNSVSASLTTLALIEAYAVSWSIPTPADSLFVYDGSEAFGGFDNSSFPSATPPADPTAFAAAQAQCVAAGVQPKNIDGCAIDKTQTGDNAFVTGAATIQQPAEVIVVVPIPKPDLIVESASLSLGNACRPYQTFVNGSITIKNIGAGTSPAVTGIGIAQIVDLRDEALGSGYRGSGVEVPALAPNASITLNVAIAYPLTTPLDTEGLRTYFARVDFGNRIAESNETNNRFASNLEINIPAGHCKNRVALIHGADSTVADAYQPGLTAKGFRTTKLAIASLNSNSSFILMGYDLIVIDSKSGLNKDWEGSALIRNAIGNAGKPILGIGQGGYSFLGQSVSPLGYPVTAHSVASIDKFVIPSPAHPSNSGPFPITSSGSEVSITTTPMAGIALLLNTPPSNIQLVAKELGVTDYFLSAVNTTPASTTGSSEALWGLDGMPNYTDNGWNALANLGWFMLP